MTFDSTSLLRQYASLQPLHQLQIPYSALQLARNQPALISSLITHPILVKFPPAKTYKRGFWKVLVALLEEGCRTPEGQAEELEVAEEIYEVYVEAMQQSQIEGTDEEGGGKPKTHKTFFFELTRGPSSIQFATKEETPASLTLLESLFTIQAGTTGLRTWGASLRLAETLLDRPTILFSDQSNTMRRVMELGSGVGFLSGVVGIIGKGHAVANAERESGEGPSGDGTSGGSTRVWATDLDANVLESLEGNVKLSASFFPFALLNPVLWSYERPDAASFFPDGLEDIIKVERLDWEDALASSDPESRSDLRQLIASADPDLILAADVVSALVLLSIFCPP
jgi:hypothetical protein